jgi:hypothetical protein
MPGWIKWHCYDRRTLLWWKSWPNAGTMFINCYGRRMISWKRSAIVSGECPVERKSNRTLTELQIIDKTCLVSLLARQLVGGVYFVMMNSLYFLCLLLVGSVNFVVMSAMGFHLIMSIWFNLFQIESSILIILNQFCWCFAGRTFLRNDRKTASFLLSVMKWCKNNFP